jgi:alkylresorcinol/alkylpyrone synthase
MPRLCAVRSAVPPNRVDQAEACRFAGDHFSRHRGDIQRLLPIFQNAGIETRYFCCPIEWLGEPHSQEEKNKTYIDWATRLSAEAANQLLKSVSLAPHQIDYIIYVNTTGLATPSIDARLINLLGLRRDIRRTPIWGLGCAGGAAGLAHAYHHLLGHPKERVLLVATELCGLTFMPGDFSKSNLVASALFGEGSAAVLLAGDQTDTDGLAMLGTASRFYPDSLDVMGWNVVSEGLQVVFAERIPRIVADNAAAELHDILGQFNLTRNEVTAWLFHPGGAKVVAAYEQALGLSNGELALSRSVLRDYGNMSSVTLLFVLERYLQTRHAEPSGCALLSALGPGFCSESVLVRA